MNLGNDKWQNTQGKLGSSSTGRGEAPETRGRELESLLATTEYESPTDTVVVRRPGKLREQRSAVSDDCGREIALVRPCLVRIRWRFLPDSLDMRQPPTANAPKR